MSKQYYRHSHHVPPFIHIKLIGLDKLKQCVPSFLNPYREKNWLRRVEHDPTLLLLFETRLTSSTDQVPDGILQNASMIKISQFYLCIESHGTSK